MSPAPQSIKTARRMVHLSELITAHAAMVEVLASGRVSETPDEPIVLCLREDGAGLEIVDGHHRVADAIHTGRTQLQAIIEDYFDDEPYEMPFYSFAAHC